MEEPEKIKRFGKFYSGRGTIFNPTPKNHEEAVQHGNALAYGKNSNYPVGTSDCFNVGISGGCGINCFIVGENRCEIPEELYEQIRAGKYDCDLPDYEETENEDLNLAVRNRLGEINGINKTRIS